MAFDAHCHLADARFQDTIDDVLERSRQAGIVGWVQGGVCPDDWARQLELRKTHGMGVVTAFGLHPWWVAGAADEQVYQALISLESQVASAQAIGELGLDFFAGVCGHKAASGVCFSQTIATRQGISKTPRAARRASTRRRAHPAARTKAVSPRWHRAWILRLVRSRLSLHQTWFF